MLDVLMGNVETAIIAIHDMRSTSKENTLSADELAALVTAALTGSLTATSNVGGALTRRYKVQFNPSSLTETAYIEPEKKTSLEDAAKTVIITPEQPTMVMDVQLLFDDMNKYDAFRGIGAAVLAVANTKLEEAIEFSVQPQVEALIAALRDPKTRLVTFQWKDRSFTGNLRRVNANYTMFSPSGKPVRATVQFSLEMAVEKKDVAAWKAQTEAVFTNSATTKVVDRREHLAGLVDLGLF